MGHGRGVALPKKQKLEEICNRVALGPTEVSVRHPVGLPLQLEKQRSECVGDHRTLRAQYPVRPDSSAGHAKLLFEIRRITRLDFEKVQTFIGIDRMISTYVTVGLAIFSFDIATRTVRNNVKDPVIIVC